jgi:hypothetical protein
VCPCGEAASEHSSGVAAQAGGSVEMRKSGSAWEYSLGRRTQSRLHRRVGEKEPEAIGSRSLHELMATLARQVLGIARETAQRQETAMSRNGCRQYLVPHNLAVGKHCGVSEKPFCFESVSSMMQGPLVPSAEDESMCRIRTRKCAAGIHNGPFTSRPTNEVWKVWEFQAFATEAGTTPTV